MANSDRSLFQQLLSHSFAELPASVKRLHGDRAPGRFVGRSVVERGRHPIAKALAAITRLPPESTAAALRVTIEKMPDGERWVRDFDGHRLSSRLWSNGTLLAERMGPLVLSFALQVVERRIEWRVVGARYMGLPLPSRWFYATTAIEQEIGGLYHFDVRAALPLIGLLVRYSGWLDEERDRVD